MQVSFDRNIIGFVCLHVFGCVCSVFLKEFERSLSNVVLSSLPSDDTFSGEVSYIVGKLFGKRHCSLCDITHGWFVLHFKRRKSSLFTLRAMSEKEKSKECRIRVRVPFDLLHRNNPLPNDYKGPFPVVLGEFCCLFVLSVFVCFVFILFSFHLLGELENGDIITVVSPEQLETCKGDAEAMYKYIDEKLKEMEKEKEGDKL